MILGIIWFVLLAVNYSEANQWRWPEGASVRIDTKIGFVEKEHAHNKQTQAKRMDDEVPFHEPSETEGFYNRPPGSGRYPVRVEGHRNQAYRVDGHAIYPLKNNQKQFSPNVYDGTVDGLQYCKCVSTPECSPHKDSEAACGAGRYLCCFKKPNKVTPQNSEYFNEVEDERPMLLPGRENLARPFPPPPGSEVTGFYGPIGRPNDNSLHAGFHKQQQAVLVGPEGPTGVVGPPSKPDVLVGPGGPTGIIGPGETNDDARRSESAQRGVLVGPGGPTGIIGPNYGRRPVLVGPGGPTGVIGPGRVGRGPGVLVGPGGPTGIIGPNYGRRNPGILTGPGGPTGIIGPGRPYIVGPGGPTGHIGPQYFGK